MKGFIVILCPLVRILRSQRPYSIRNEILPRNEGSLLGDTGPANFDMKPIFLHILGFSKVQEEAKSCAEPAGCL